jgi:CHAT domain-containing protein
VDPKFDFNDTELLTLSACDTAMGGTAGDGTEVDGFGILAQQKGAKSVIATLWAVNDESTGFLMQNFYRLWTSNAGMPKAESLRQAQLAFLRSNVTTKPTSNQRGFPVPGQSGAQVKRDPLAPYSHPYYWAPFILIGNWN